jgi:Flp pilus assembly pilin Flp
MMLPRLSSIFYRLMRKQRGATMVEYACMLGMISVAVMAVLPGIAQKIQNVLGAAGSALN